MPYQILLFYRLDVRVVDEVLQRLFGSRRLPPRVLVCSDDANLLGALDSCWARKLALNAVVLPPTDLGVAEAIETILEHEQIDMQTLITVNGNDGVSLRLKGLVGPLIAAAGADMIETALNLLLEPSLLAADSRSIG